ncbi:MAG: DMT family transporter [Nitrospirae bacterium]|nr:DMT family transporter [Nitrospirota bacterium]
MQDNKKAAFYALTACIIWGTVYVAIKTGLDHGLRPLTFAGTRFLASGLIFLAITAARGRHGLMWRDLPVLAILGIFQTGIQNALFFYGVELTGVGVSAIFINTQPFFVILLAPLFFKGSGITARRLSGAALGFGGVLVTSLGHGAMTGEYGLGVAALILSALTWGGSSIAAKKIMKGRAPMAVTAVQMTAGALPLLLAGMAVEGPPLTEVDATGLAVLGYLVIFATSIPFYLWYKALQAGEVGRVSVFSFILPVLGVLSGALLLGEPLDMNILLGMAMVAAGIVIVNKG